MNSLFFGLITLAVIVAALVFILVMLEFRVAAKNLTRFMKTTEDSLRPAFDDLQLTLRSMREVTGNVDDVSKELQLTLRSMKNITDNVTTVTDDIKALSGSIRDVGEKAKHVSMLIDELTTSGVSRVSGWRAGIRAATDVLLKGLLTGKTG